MTSGKKTVSAKADEKLRSQIEDYRKEHDLDKSDAVRELWRDGLEANEIHRENAELREELEERRARDERTIAVTKPAAVAIVGWVLVAIDWLTVASGQPVGWAGVVTIVAAVAYGWLGTGRLRS